MSSILLQLPATTYQAYNDWGGKSLYPSGSPDRSRRVSFDRPGGTSYLREIGFLLWLRKQRIAVECCTSIDLHADSSLLNGYRLLLSVGHDEYWSKEMRDHVESFIANGGNVAFFSGNVCWWQIRLEDNNRTMVCYRTALEDPLTGIDDSRVTVNWYSAPVSRPENYLTGVSFRNGGGIWQPCSSSMKLKSFRVCQASHWVFEGTGLQDGDLFGMGENIVGYETDGADYRLDAQGDLHLTGHDGTPPSFVVLATSDLTDWGPCGKAGRATLGVFRRTGTVFTAATTDWVRGLSRPDSAVPKITLNVINKLRDRYPSDHWETVGDATAIGAVCASDGRLFASDHAQGLVWREFAGQNRKWQFIGSAPGVSAMAVGENPKSPCGQSIYAISRSAVLLRRDAVERDAPWEAVGSAVDLVALAAANHHLYAFTSDAKLLCSQPSPPLDWECIGFLAEALAMTALGAELFAVTADLRLWSRPAQTDTKDGEISWTAIGTVPTGTVSLAAADGKLVVVSNDYLWWRDSVISLTGNSSLTAGNGPRVAVTLTSHGPIE